ncbi:hypothetical protein [Bacillus sp. FJAT-50079]|uniref:hypothetical protein n=1 Tax=Bacillus sp. FJAT-50079 TaxID=2833577 RepID=UPI001BC9491E|nr:hypothetical protein [Bacillus sp. FJAT-50079]MBS4209498.1 hypothetical protein [Bacillus sp. FJAT-50079]
MWTNFINKGDAILGIHNYEPIFYTDINDFIKDHGEVLKGVIGSTIEEIWTVHKRMDGEFWADCPIILIIGGKRLVFCSIRDEISITWGQIDVMRELDWYGSQESNLEWRKNALSRYHSFIGKTKEDIEVIQRKQEAYDLSGVLLDLELSLNGIGLNTGDSYLSIFNAFDETGFTDIKEKNRIYIKI